MRTARWMGPLLALVVGCGGRERYLVRRDARAAGPVVAAVRRDGTRVELRAGTFAPTAEPAPTGTYVVKGRGPRHPRARAGYILIGTGLVLGIAISAGMFVGASTQFCTSWALDAPQPETPRAGCSDAAGTALLVLGGLSAAIGDSMWIAGIVLAAQGGRLGPEIVPPPQSAALTVPIATVGF